MVKVLRNQLFDIMERGSQWLRYVHVPVHKTIWPKQIDKLCGIKRVPNEPFGAAFLAAKDS
jgi:hypothetical protein